jgi:hypothetical protein
MSFLQLGWIAKIATIICMENDIDPHYQQKWRSCEQKNLLKNKRTERWQGKIFRENISTS